MTIILTKIPKRTMSAVYWKFISTNSYGGAILDTPIEIKCRWQDVSIEFIAPGGDTRISRSVVFPDRILVIGSYLWLGKLTEGLLIEEPLKDKTVFPIIQFQDIPDFKEKKHLLKAML